MRNKDLEEQASGWLAIFTNENGNVSICQVIFDSKTQATAWIRERLKAAGATAIKVKDLVVTGTVRGGLFGTSELTWQLLPAVHAGADVKGAQIADHSFGVK